MRLFGCERLNFLLSGLDRIPIKKGRDSTPRLHAVLAIIQRRARVADRFVTGERHLASGSVRGIGQRAGRTVARPMPFPVKDQSKFWVVPATYYPPLEQAVVILAVCVTSVRQTFFWILSGRRKSARFFSHTGGHFHRIDDSRIETQRRIRGSVPAQDSTLRC